MDPLQLAVSLAYSTLKLFSERQKLQKHEMLLYTQACRTLAGYMRVYEIKVEEGHDDEVEA